MRNLVSVRTITAITPIPNADAIEAVTIDDGWTCVSKKGEFSVGDQCVYFEIDSFVDHTDPRFAFLAKNAIKWNGLEGARIKTIKLRGQVSQGLALPVSAFDDELKKASLMGHNLPEEEFEQTYPYGVLASILNVTKWEKLLPACLGGTARGNFPSFIRKTDQERLQNMFRRVAEDTETLYEVTIKLDGSSATFYLNDGVFGVCSRNLDLVETDENAYWKVARQYNIEEKLRAFVEKEHNAPKNLAIQGEIYGAGINGNWEQLIDIRLAVFDIWNIDTQKYAGFEFRWDFCALNNLPHVPFVEHRKFGFQNIQEAVEYAKGPSIHNKIREGVVFKAVDGSKSFKIINPDFLLGGGDD